MTITVDQNNVNVLQILLSIDQIKVLLEMHFSFQLVWVFIDKYHLLVVE